MNKNGGKVVKTKNSIVRILTITIIIIGVMFGADAILKKLNINGIEGYMYSQAMDLVKTTATTSNATCSNATSSNATSSNATSSTATTPNATGVELSDELLQQIERQVDEDLYYDYQETYRDEYDSYDDFYDEYYDMYYNKKLEETKKEKEENEVVTFLEDNMIYVIIIGIAVMTAIITGVILIVDKKTKKIQ